MGQIKKIQALYYIKNTPINDQHDYLFWFDPFYRLGQKIVKNFLCFLEDGKPWKLAFEINWPLMVWLHTQHWKVWNKNGKNYNFSLWSSFHCTLICSWHQKTKLQIHQFTNLKCCIKARESFKTPFNWCIRSYLLLWTTL